MKKFLLAGVALTALLGGSAMAADRPLPRLAALAPVSNWTGFYAGLNMGYTGLGNNDITSSAVPSLANDAGLPAGPAASVAAVLARVGTGTFPGDLDGFIGGGQIGYNFQMASFVAGIEADIVGVGGADKASQTTRNIPDPNFPTEVWNVTVTAQKKLDYLGTLRGRLGFLWTPSLLVYGTGGLAYGRVHTGMTFAAQDFTSGVPNAGFPGGFTTATFSNTRGGWTAGGGLEWMIAPGWTIKGEYLYYDLGNVSSNFALSQTCALAPCTGVTVAAATGTATTRYDGQLARFGFNYKWGGAY
jgi:outer membrane immunogenic protein